MDALDVSDVAVAAVQREARRRGVAVEAARVDLAASPELPRRPYDVVVNTRFLERSLFGALSDALAPGGLLVFEAFTTERRGMNPAYQLEPGELFRAFGGLEVVDYEEGESARLVARKPA